jgi:glycosyltransferase involved in cell wall biosynthesis
MPKVHNNQLNKEYSADSPSTLFFSVVIPVYNKKREIIRCLKSCVSQTFTDFEIIVVDDGSTDGSGELAHQFQDDRIAFWRTKNSGQGAARNFGIKKASGRYVAFLDADDTWAPEHLLELSMLITNHPDATAASAQFAYIKKGQIKHPKFKNLLIRGDVILNYIEVTAEQTSPIITNSICIRRDTLLTIGGFDESLPLAQDVDLWIRLHCSYDILHSLKTTSFYHIDSSNMVTKSSDRVARYLLFVDKLTIYIADAKYSDHINNLQKLRNGLLKSLAYRAAVNHDMKARNHFVSAHPNYWRLSTELVYRMTRFSTTSTLAKFFLEATKKAQRQIRDWR